MTWKYLSLLNENIKILLTIALGWVFGRFGIFNAETFVPQAVRFVFHIALPLLVVRGLGIGTDFYDDSFLWSYIGIFLILRAVALIAAVVWVATKSKDGLGNRNGIGEVAAIWLSLTWISTVILGIPIAKAVFGDPTKGSFYGLLAGISSFIFQLPFQLLFLECHTLEREYLENKETSRKDVDVEANSESGVEQVPEELTEIDAKESTDDESSEPSPLLLWLEFARRRDVRVKILCKVLYNPVLWGIACGFALSLSTLGPTYLKPLTGPKSPNPDYVDGLGFIWDTTGWFADCVSPISLFAMGIWMEQQGKKLFQIPMHTAIIFMLAKLVLVPLLILGLSKAVHLNNEAGRAAVLISSLPISMASFSLGSQYKYGESMLSGNVALGTLLMLPTVLLWNLVMDKMGIFPIN